jgi:spore coat polysaccharide biosynthesis predicted glycosyltransferase SpsG
LHPDQDVEEIRSYLISIPNNFIFVYDKIPILLKQVNMIIHNGGTAIFECIGYGIPFVNYIDNSLSLDALNAAFPDQMNITEVDLTNIKEVFKKQKICPNINLFEDVNIENWKKVLNE